jgi:tetratricopeptide (TPR) repeat protein
LEKSPERESLLVRLAFLSHDRKDLKAAAEYFDQLFQVNPSHAAFHGRQAHILGQLGNFDRAISEANLAIKLDPTLSQVHEWLSQVHQLRRETEQSQSHQTQAKKLREAGF